MRNCDIEVRWDPFITELLGLSHRLHLAWNAGVRSVVFFGIHGKLLVSPSHLVIICIQIYVYIFLVDNYSHIIITIYICM